MYIHTIVTIIIHENVVEKYIAKVVCSLQRGGFYTRWFIRVKGEAKPYGYTRICRPNKPVLFLFLIYILTDFNTDVPRVRTVVIV